MPMKQKMNNFLESFTKKIGLFRMAALSLAFFIIVLSLMFTGFFKVDRYAEFLESFKAGQIANKGIFLSRDLVYLDSVATEIERHNKEMQILPAFLFHSNSLNNIKNHINTFRNYFSIYKKTGSIKNIEDRKSVV